MKRIALFACAALLAASVAQAGVVGTWRDGGAVGSYTKWIATLTPTNGTVIGGIDLRVGAPAGTFSYTGTASTTLFTAAPNNYTDFLVHQSHMAMVWSEDDGEYVEQTVEDLTVLTDYSQLSAAKVGGIFAVKGAGTDYAGGWSSAFDVMEVVIKNGKTPADFTYSTCGLSGAAGPVANGQWSSMQSEVGQIVWVPEPGTFALLASGLVGLLAYAWRKRK